ncbi:aspartate/glutamate racemase family protein [Kordiimonas marina]|uniref:aspartate/glutamate racemase family protein n=1 Tax=Kordiimonas marina TaxID=2872312 RepID=UPI001FF5E583|nr:aspartate/glutamate racemase family protein [Kordiimonas marina]MCJ9430613.1 aspartate/glutamate racemase family protein [Kordiimonas marina]
MVHIRIVTPIITKGVRDLADIDFLKRPDLEFSHVLLEAGPSSIENEFEHALAVPGVAARAIEAEKDGADALIVDCLGDPGVPAARELVRIPIIGPGEASMHMAAMMGHRFSIVTVVESVRPMLDNLATLYGVAGKMASLRVIDIPVLELEARLGEVQQKLAEQAVEAVEKDHADTIILGCTGFLGCASAISTTLKSKGLDVPVIDPIPAAVCMAEAFVRAGLSHSKHSYATPNIKPIAGYPF